MRHLVLVLVGAGLVATASCGQSAPPQHVTCFGTQAACECDLEDIADAAGQTECNQTAIPDALCCAAPGWPSSGNCTCVSADIFCGVVPGDVTSEDGGPGQDTCVCSSDPSIGSQQVVGATCYPNATTTAGDELGICCLFSADAPGSLGIPSCGCEAGLHTCGTGGTAVASCSAASFPPSTSTCEGDTPVPSCD